MKRRISIITLIIMLVTMMSMSTIMSFAANHSCGEHTFNQVLTSDASAISYTNNIANVYLDDDVELSELNICVDEGKTLNLCLQGHVLKGATADTTNAVITVKGTLNLYDCGSTVHHFKDDTTKTGLWVWDSTEKASEHTVTGGVITGGNTPTNDNGAGILVTNTGSVTIDAGNIVGNYALYDGSAICNYGNLVINGGQIQGNSTSNGGQGIVFSSGDNAKTKIKNCIISNNDGAGLYLKDIKEGNGAIVSDAKFNDNLSGLVLEDGIVNIEDCNINNNKYYGINTSNTTDTISIKNTNIKNNGDWGIEQHYGSVVIDGCTISGNGYREATSLFYGQGGVLSRDSITLSGEVNITGNNTEYNYDGCDYAGNLLVTGNKITLDKPSSKMKIGISVLKWKRPSDPNWPETISNEYGASSYLSCFTSDDETVKLYESLNEGKRTLMLGMSTFNDGWGYTSGDIKEASNKYEAGKQYEVYEGMKFEFCGWSTKRDEPDYIDTIIQPSNTYYAVWKDLRTGNTVRTEPIVMWMMDEDCESKAQGWSYKIGEEENILTLDSCTVAGKDLLKACAINSSTDKPLKIVLKGTNTLGIKKELPDLAAPYTTMRNGIVAQSDICITGTGSLTIYDFESGIETSANMLFDKDFTGNVVIYDSGSEWAPEPICALKANGNITIKNGNFELNNDNTSGINAGGSFSFEAGKLLARGNGHAITVGEEGNFTISEATRLTANAAWDGKGTAVTPTVEEGVVTEFESAKYITLSTIKDDPTPSPDKKAINTGDMNTGAFAIYLIALLLSMSSITLIVLRRNN